MTLGAVIMTDRCINNHDPEYSQVKPNGTRVCSKCADMYHSRTRRFGSPIKSPSRKATNRNEHYNR